jgi:hypothetical protein
MKEKKYPFNLLDKCHINFDKNLEYEIFDVNAQELLLPERFDLFAILLYIDHKVKGIRDLSFAKEIYKNRTHIMTGFTNSEIGNPYKNNFDDFISTLDNLIETFRISDFDPQKSLIPIDRNNVLLDGAHRVSCAAYFNKKVRVVKFSTLNAPLDTASFFEKQALHTQYLDAMALEYCRWRKNTYMAFIWPKSFSMPNEKKEADELINRSCTVIYRKKMRLTYTAIRNLMLQIYGHMSWIGTIDNHFSTTYAKADEVWDNNGYVEFVLLESDEYKKVFDLKQQVRAIYKIDLASIHTTDNYRETWQAANLIYNLNSLHHLETGQPDKFAHSFKLIEKYKNLLCQLNCNFDNYILDSSIVMAIYGIREAGDLDYLTIDPSSDLIAIRLKNKELIDCNNNLLDFHVIPLADLIYNPRNYFVFNELKFMSLDRILVFKQAKNEKKDKNDVKLIVAYRDLNNHKFQFFMLRLKNNFRRRKIIYRRNLIMYILIFLQKIYLYKFIRKIYRTIKSKNQ